MKTSIFEFNDYREFLIEALDDAQPARGARSRLARHLGCQTAFISQVLAGKVDLSLEHAVSGGSFFGLAEAESHFFVLLVHLARAGSTNLRRYYETQIAEIREKRMRVAERISVRKGLSKDDQAVYYSGWHYAAIHVALSLGKSMTAAEISVRLGIPLPVVQEALAFLFSAGLAEPSEGGYKISERRIHLRQDSVFVKKHHTNWRMKAVNALDFPQPNDLHYSGVFTLSERDFLKLREQFLESLQSAEPVLRESTEEVVAAICLDWFELSGI